MISRVRKRRAFGMTIAAAMALYAGFALAQSSGGPYAIPRQSIDGGAQRASSSTYAISGSIGQADAGPAMSGPTFAVRGGFHVAAPSAPLPDPLFANGFE